jgi:hypothetical protein
MKLKHLIRVLLILLLGSGVSKAQEYYGFEICGVKVTSENVDNLDKIEGVTVGDNGYISYSLDDNKLIINNITIETNADRGCINALSKCKGLPFTLHLKGENQFKSPENSAFVIWDDTRIEGSGKLSISTMEPGLFVIKDATLTIEDCYIDIVSETIRNSFAGINGSWTDNSLLVIKNASIYVKATDTYKKPYPYAIGGFNGISLEEVTITEPSNGEIADYTFQSGGTYTRKFIMSGDKPATEVRIEKSLAVERVNPPNLHLLPNPANHEARLEGAMPGMTVSVYSMQGERLLSVTTDQAGSAGLEVSHLPSGSYILKVGDNELKLVVKH